MALLNPGDTDLRLQEEFEAFFEADSLVELAHLLPGDLHTTGLVETSSEHLNQITERIRNLGGFIVDMKGYQSSDVATVDKTATGSFIISEELQPYRDAAVNELIEGVRILNLNSSSDIDVKEVKEEGYKVLGSLVSERELHYKELAMIAARKCGIDFDDNRLIFQLDLEKSYKPEVHQSISPFNGTLSLIKTLSGDIKRGQSSTLITRTMGIFFNQMNYIASINQGANVLK